jgi:autotransporter-associated beta strand protein
LNDSTEDFNLSAEELGRLSSSGTVTIGAADGTGAIAIGGSGQIGALNYALTLRGGEVAFSNTLRVSSARTLTLNTGAVTSAAGDGFDITAGTLDLDTHGAVGAPNNPLVTTIGNLQGTVDGNLFLREATSLTISGALSTGSNTIELNGGIFNLGASERIDANSRLNVNGGTFAMSSYSQTVAGVTLTSGTIGGASVLTSMTDFEVKSGTISPKLAGSVGLNKTTSGTVILNNSVNTFTGATTISGGTLAINADAGLGTPPADAVPGHLVIDGGTLGTQGFVLVANRGIRIGNASGDGTGTIDVSSGTLTYNGIITDDGTGGHRLVKTGMGTLRLGGVNAYRGGTVVREGLISIAADSGLGIAPTTKTPGHLTLGGGGLRATESFELAANRGISLGLPSGSGTGNIAVLQDKTLMYNGLITNHDSGIGTLAKKDGGTLVLGGENTFTGGTTYAGKTSILESNSGVIQINHSGALGASGGIFFGDSGGLRYGSGVSVDMSGRINTGTSKETVRIDTNGSDVTFANALTGSGRLEKLGGGRLTLAAAGTTTAPTLYVRGGELAVTAGSLELTDTIKDAALDERASAFVRNAALRIAGGTVRTAGSLVVGYASEPATLAVSSGCLEVGANPDAPARDLFAGASIAATVDISGGTTEIHGEFTVGSNSSATVNVRGGMLTASRLRHFKQNHAVVNLTGGNVTVDEVVLETNTTADGSLTVNLDAGGTLTSDRIYLNRTGGTSGTHSLSLRFNGGTLKKKSDRDGPLIDTIVGTGGTLVWDVVIAGGGAAIDTNGFDTHVVRPLLRDSTRAATQDGGLLKKGIGTLTLAAVHTFTGPTTVESGTLALADTASNNSIASSPAIDVRAGATLNVIGLDGSAASTLILASGQTLTGKGTVQGNLAVAAGATLAPGSTPGILTQVGNLTLAGETKIEIAGAGAAGAADGYSQIQVTGNGTVTILSGATLTLVETYTAFHPSASQMFTLIDNDGDASDPVTGTFSDRADGATVTVNGKTLKLFYNGEDGNNVVFIEAGTTNPPDDGVAGVAISKTVAVVSESGTTDTFTVVLTAQPETHVTLTVSGSDASEATVSPAVLVFSPEDWDSPQTVTITGVDDFERDGDQESVITIAVDAEQSDGGFAGVAAQTVSLTTLDNDSGWQNVDYPFDVNGDGFVTANDALILIDRINGNAGNSTLPSPPLSPPPYYDVNNDSLCTPLDILLVINWINTQSAASSSGEGEGISRDASPAATAVPLEARRSPAVQPVFATAERLSDPIAAPRPASAPIPPPATRLQASFSSAKPGRPLHRISPDWTVSVDAALEIWEPEWDEVAGLPSAA